MKKDKGDVAWFIPGKEKPITYSTSSTRQLINILAEDHNTISDVYNAIHYDQEAKDTMKLYIDKGYGNQIARTWFYD